jgi:capsular polysaccharide transport system permease protein
VVAVEVRAFTAEDAKKVATTVLELSEELINEIFARARADAVRSSQQEVKRMEDLLRSHRSALRSFRDTQQESITVFAIALVLWAFGVLIVYAIRDHAL